jgi:O-methyltransferase
MRMMQVEGYAKLLEDVEYELCRGRRSVGVLGLTPVTTQLLRSLAPSGLVQAVQAVYVPDGNPSLTSPLVVPVRRFEALSKAQHDMLVVAADANKEDLLLAALAT